MSKNKIKMLLINDYIELKRCEILFDSTIDDKAKSTTDGALVEVKKLSYKLLEIYEKIFFKFGMMDLSLAILKKEFFGTNKSVSMKFTDKDISDMFNKIKTIKDSLTAKLKKLALNEIEMNYVVQNLSI